MQTSSDGHIGGRRRRSLAAIEQGDLAERVAGLHDVERELAAVGRAGADADLSAHHSVERIAGIALAKTRFPPR